MARREAWIDDDDLVSIEQGGREERLTVGHLATAVIAAAGGVEELRGPAGDDGDDGDDGLTILPTTGRPADVVGSDGDHALDAAAGMLYGPKASGTWPAGVSIRGPPGDPGRDGAGAVESVNGATGAVVLVAADVGALPDDYTPPADRAAGTSSARRLGSGAVEAAPGAGALGYAVYHGDLAAARPVGFGAIAWIGFPAEPTNRIEPDLWLVPRATEPVPPELVVVQQVARGFEPATSHTAAWGSTPRAGNILVGISSVDKAAGGSGPTPSNTTAWPVVRQSSGTSISVGVTARLARGDADDTLRAAWINNQPSNLVLLELEWDGSTPVIRAVLVTSESVVTSVDLTVTADGDGIAIAACTIDTGPNWVRPHTWTGATRIVEIDGNTTNDAPLDVAGVAVTDGQVVAVRSAAAGGSTGDQAAAVLLTFGRP